MERTIPSTASEEVELYLRTYYSLLRSPAEVQIRTLEEANAGARARRRRCFFNGRETLACFIASRSDIDDVIPMLTAYQIEWNKMHALLRRFLASESQFDFSRLEDDTEL